MTASKRLRLAWCLVCLSAVLADHGGDELDHGADGVTLDMTGLWMGLPMPPTSDLVSTHLRVDMYRKANVTCAQGHYEGPAVLQALFGTSNWPALTGIDLAVGVITLGSNGGGGCGVIPFHNHPNCYEVMTTLSGYGAYGQIRPDGTTQWSRVLEAGATWVMQQGSQHYYRNLDPEGTWVFEIAFTCSEVGSQSMWKWIGSLDSDIAVQFFPGLSYSAAGELTIRPDDNLRKDSARYIAQCELDVPQHDAVTDDSDLYSEHFTSAFFAELPPGGISGEIIFDNAPFSQTGAESWHGDRAALTLGFMRMRPQSMMRPTVCSNANVVYHVLQGEVVVAQWTWDNKLAVDVVKAHDLVLVPIGSVHFLINAAAHSLRVMAHYDTAAEPLLSVASNFFATSNSRLLEAVLLTTTTAAEALAAVEPQAQFAPYEGSIEVLKSWVATQPNYQPLTTASLAERVEDEAAEVAAAEQSYAAPRSVTGLWGGQLLLLVIVMIVLMNFAMAYAIWHLLEMITDMRRSMGPEGGDDSDSDGGGSGSDDDDDAPAVPQARPKPPVRKNKPKAPSRSSKQKTSPAMTVDNDAAAVDIQEVLVES